MEVVVFTNGCFDLIHPGHIDLLQKARALGTKLIVGINSDDSVRAIKGKERPFLDQDARATVLRGLRSVDEVLIFDENTPERLIKEIKPDILVKGGDWAPDQIVGAEFVLKNGGEVFSIPFVKDFSSSKIVEKIKISNKQTDNSSLENTGEDIIKDYLEEYLEIFNDLLKYQLPKIIECGKIIFAAMLEEKRIFFIENNGKNSSVTGLIENNRFKPITPDQIEVLVQRQDIVIASDKDSDSQESILVAVMKAREVGCRTISIVGKSGKKLASLCDYSIMLSTKEPELIYECIAVISQAWLRFLNKTHTFQQT